MAEKGCFDDEVAAEKDNKALMGVYAQPYEDIEKEAEESIAWTLVDKPGSAASSNSQPVMADDNDLLLVQESFDSVTRITLAIRKMRSELLSNASAGPTVRGMAKRGIDILRGLTEPSQKVAMLLIADRQNLTHDEVMTTLKCTASSYKRVLEFDQELAATYKRFGGKVTKRDQM